MEKQEFLDLVTQIGTCEDDVQRRDLLSQLSESVGADYDNLATLTETNRTLTSDNESLRDANMKLFLRIGDNKPPEIRRTDETGFENPKEKRKFDDLFNDKGGLK